MHNAGAFFDSTGASSVRTSEANVHHMLEKYSDMLIGIIGQKLKGMSASQAHMMESFDH
jgi:hypothetical protein